MKTLVIRSAVVAAVGGLIFGFDTAVIRSAGEKIALGKLGLTQDPSDTVDPLAAGSR